MYESIRNLYINNKYNTEFYITNFHCGAPLGIPVCRIFSRERDVSNDVATMERQHATRVSISSPGKLLARLGPSGENRVRPSLLYPHHANCTTPSPPARRPTGPCSLEPQPSRPAPAISFLFQLRRPRIYIYILPFYIMFIEN